MCPVVEGPETGGDPNRIDPDDRLFGAVKAL
jgi:hypothetical protein